MDSRFHTLDAMRGIAAIAVVIMHAGEVLHLHTFHYAYMAVDFFFVLSGFVLARAYEDKLKQGLAGRTFLEMRLIRLYPLFAVGVALGIFCMIGKIAVRDVTALAPVDAAIALVCNALMLPALTSPAQLFPYDPPAWSLFFEIVINGVFGFFLYRVPSALIGAVCAVIGLAFLVAIRQANYGDLGSSWDSLDVGLMRVGFSFPLGLVLARLFRKTRPRRSPLAYGVLAALAIVLCLALPVRFDWVYDTSCVLVVLPVLVWLGARYEMPVSGLGPLLGDTSYPLYAIHFPILQIVSFALVTRLHAPAVIVALVFVPSAFFLARLASRYFDVPVRVWLSRKYHLRKTALPSTVG